MQTPGTSSARASGGVQSLGRALDLVEIVAEAGGHLAIGEIAGRTDMPLPTIHRLLKTLVDRGFMRQMSNRRYALGFRLIPLGQVAGATLGTDAKSVLGDLVDVLGESANLAVLSGDHAEYVAQAQSSHSMRVFTEVGRRVELHATGVGKALLARLDDGQVVEMVQRVGLRAHTEHTISTISALESALEEIRTQGYALDDQEQEVGVRCVAVAVPVEPPTGLAISISGPVPRMTDMLIERAVPLLRAAGEHLASTWSGRL